MIHDSPNSAGKAKKAKRCLLDELYTLLLKYIGAGFGEI